MIPVCLPINSTSLGAAGFHLAENMNDISLFPIGGGMDFSSFEPCSQELKERLHKSALLAQETHNVKDLSFKLWHHFCALERVTDRQVLYTFHEVNKLTKTELNALNQQEAVIVPCNYNKEVFQECGVTKPIHVIPLGVDRNIFHPLEKHTEKSGPYIFVMAGKFETRKLHLEILQAFVSIFGNNPNVKLRCCISNRFVDMKNVYNFIHERIFRGMMPTNVEFIDWLPTERHFADFLSHADCLISPSRAESFNLPLIQAMSCGLNVVTNADHAHKDYVNNENAIIIPSEGMILAKDDVFFRDDGRTNTGDWYNVSVNAVAGGLIEAFKRGKTVNAKGIETSMKFTWQKAATEITNICHSLKT